MSIKGTRPVKNLTTLIECSENGDDSASPMLPSDLTVISSVNDIALSTVEDANVEVLTVSIQIVPINISLVLARKSDFKR